MNLKGFKVLKNIWGRGDPKDRQGRAPALKCPLVQAPSGRSSEAPVLPYCSLRAFANSALRDALRRAALGLIKIALNSNLNLDIKSLSDEVLAGYIKFDTQKLLNFIKDRLYTLYDFNPSVVKACINSGENDIKKLDSAINALGEISVSSEFKDNFATFKRLANIIKDEKIGSLDESLFENDAEKALNSAFKEIKFNGDYKAYLNSLFGLKGVITVIFVSEILNTSLSVGRLVKITHLRIDLKKYVLMPVLACAVGIIVIKIFSPFFQVLHIYIKFVLEISIFIMIYLF